ALADKNSVTLAFQKQIIHQLLLSSRQMKLPAGGANLFQPRKHPVEDAGSFSRQNLLAQIGNDLFRLLISILDDRETSSPCLRVALQVNCQARVAGDNYVEPTHDSRRLITILKFQRHRITAS